MGGAPYKYSDVLKIGDRLKKVCRREGDFAVYVDNYTDEQIAAELQVPVGLVAKVRIDAYGKIETMAPVAMFHKRLTEALKTVETLEGFAAQQETLLVNMSRLYHELADKHDKLCLHVSNMPSTGGARFDLRSFQVGRQPSKEH